MPAPRRTGRVGRPSKFTPEVQRRIVDTISAGVPVDVACRYAGIDDSTYRRWLEKGRRQRRGEWRSFLESVEQAEARAETRVVAEWQKHIPKKWEAARDFLARRFPERWAQTQRLELRVEQEVEALLEDLRSVLPPEVYRQVLQGLAARGRGEAPAGAARGRGRDPSGEGTGEGGGGGGAGDASGGAPPA